MNSPTPTSKDVFMLALGGIYFHDQVIHGALAWAEENRLPAWVPVASSRKTEQAWGQDVRGMITTLYNPSNIPELRNAPYPVIIVSNTLEPTPGLGHILNDDEAIGRMAAQHLIKLGYRDFLAIQMTGHPRRRFAGERAESFVREATAAGGRARLLEMDTEIPTVLMQDYIKSTEEKLRTDLESLPLNAAIFAVNDWLAELVQMTLADHFPERSQTTAVLGVDNSRTMGHMGPLPALSTVLPDFRGIGAAALEWLVAHPGEKGKAATAELMRRLPPLRVIERASTAGRACADPLTATIARWAWEQVRREVPTTTNELARRHGMSRRSLDRKFAQHLGQPAGEFLQSLRLNYARELLLETRLPIAEVSERCGFSKQSALSRALRDAHGITPRDLRKQKSTP